MSGLLKKGLIIWAVLSIISLVLTVVFTNQGDYAQHHYFIFGSLILTAGWAFSFTLALGVLPTVLGDSSVLSLAVGLIFAKIIIFLGAIIHLKADSELPKIVVLPLILLLIVFLIYETWFSYHAGKQQTD